MATYCSRDDLTAVGVNANALRSATAGEITGAIEMASDLIDSYLRQQFALPLEDHGRDITRAAAIIAAYDLMSARGFNPNESEDSPLAKRYADVIAWLKMIAEGTVTPDVTESETPETPSEASTAAGRPVIRTDLARGINEYALDEDVPFQGRRR